LFFITGVDAFAEIATWHDYPALLDASHFVIVTRPGYPASDVCRRLPELAPRFVEGPGCGSAGPEALDRAPTRVLFVEARTANVSSTEIRRRLAAGDGAQDLLPPDVARHIHQHRLYQPSHTAFELHGQV
jgi:nicotinate-nucleotide adenylyltransferase